MDKVTAASCLPLLHQTVLAARWSPRLGNTGTRLLGEGSLGDPSSHMVSRVAILSKAKWVS